MSMFGNTNGRVSINGRPLVASVGTDPGDASVSGRAVLTGTPAQGATALGLGTGNSPNFAGLNILPSMMLTGLLLQGSGQPNKLSILPWLGDGAYNGLVKAGDQALLWQGTSSDQANAGGLCLVPWSGAMGGIRISYTGSVGIGVRDPQAMFDVAGSAKISGPVSIITGDGTGAFNFKSGLGSISYTTYGSQTYCWHRGSEFFFGTDSAHPLRLGANNTARISILPNGNVGIGTLTPDATLSVAGTAKAEGALLAGYAPQVIIYDTSGATANQRRTSLNSYLGDFYIQRQNDDGSYVANVMKLYKDGTQIDLVSNLNVIGKLSPNYIDFPYRANYQIALEGSGGTLDAYIGIAGTLSDAPAGSLRIRGDNGVAIGVVNGITQFLTTNSGVLIAGTLQTGKDITVKGSNQYAGLKVSTSDNRLVGGIQGINADNSVGVLFLGDSGGTAAVTIRGDGQDNFLPGPLRPGVYTVATLPNVGLKGRLAWCTNGRATTGLGAIEASPGTGCHVADNGSAWKIIGTNSTVSS